MKHPVLFAISILAATAHAAPPLAYHDFTTGEGRGLEWRIDPDEYAVREFDGHRVLFLWPTQVVPVELKHGQQKPEFPLVNAEKAAAKPKQTSLFLTLSDKQAAGIEPGVPTNLLVVLKIYDAGYLGTFGSRHFAIQGKRPPGQREANASSMASGSHWAVDPICKVRILERTLRLDNVLLNGGYEGADLRLWPQGYILLQRIEIHVEDTALYEHTEDLLRSVTKRQSEAVKARSLADEQATQALRMIRWLNGYGRVPGKLRQARDALQARRAEILAAFTALEVAVDDLYFKGRAAMARGQKDRVVSLYSVVDQRLVRAVGLAEGLEQTAEAAAGGATRALRNIEQAWWFAPLRTSPPAMPFQGGKRNPMQRIQMVGASGFADHNLWEECFSRSFGQTCRQMWYLYVGLQPDGTFDVTYRPPEFRERAFMRAYMEGMTTSTLTFRHQYIITGDLPAWFTKEHADSEDLWVHNGAGERPKKINAFNDKVREYFQLYHAGIAREQRHTPGWNLALLGTEGCQFYAGQGGCENGYSPSAVAKFRTYLKDRYGTVEALRETTGAEYASFEDVEPPPDMGMTLRRVPGPLDYDFERFRRKCLVDIYEMSAQAMKAESPEMLTWLETMARFDLTAPHAIDTYNLFRVADVGATHSQGEFNAIWNMSVHRYFPDSIYGKQEHFPAENEAHVDPGIEYLRAATRAGWNLELFCGSRAVGTWSCPVKARRGFETYGPYMYDGRRDIQTIRRSGETPVFRRRMDLWDPLLRNLRWRHPRLGMLYSTATQLVGWPYQETEFEGLAMHQWLFYDSTPYFVVHEDALVDTRDNLGEYHVIVVPFSPVTRRELDGPFTWWVKEGGTLIASGPFGLYDQYGQPDLKLLKAVFGEGLTVTRRCDEITRDRNRLDAASIAWLRAQGIFGIESVTGWFHDITLKDAPDSTRVLLRLEDGSPVLLEGELERGRVMFSACPLAQNQLANVVRRTIRRRLAPFARPTRQYGLAVFPLQDAVHHLYLGVINFDYDRPVRDTITVDARLRRVVDLGIDHGFPVPFRVNGLQTEIDVELEPGDGTILDIGFEADLRYAVRRAGQELALPEESGTLTAEQFGQALTAIERSDRPPEARREAFALASVAGLYYGRGAAAHAHELLQDAKAMDTPPTFVQLADEAVEAVRTTQPLTLDGALNDWPDAHRYALRGSATSGGAFMLAHDGEFLYVAAMVRDGDVKDLGEVAAGFNWRYGCDGVQVLLNPCDTTRKMPIGLVDMALHDGYSQILCSVSGRVAAYPLLVTPPARVRSATARLEDGYVMEIAIPMRDYHILPVAGASFGFDLELKGATGTFSRYARRENRSADGKRAARCYLKARTGKRP